MMRVITHRGLDPSKKNYFVESSREAFEDQLARGFGLEFDLQFTKDNQIIILHDSDLERISLGWDKRKICEINMDEILAMEFAGCHIVSFNQLLKFISANQTPDVISAIHIKSESQRKDKLDILLSYMDETDNNKLIIFDVKIETAMYLKEKNSKLQLAPSVAHLFDIKRYNDAVGGTLMPLELALSSRKLFNWVWLDEWDRVDINNGAKTLYTKEIFEKIHNQGIHIALVTPELHATSPDLLGGEKHSDAINKGILFNRIKEIIKLKPDAICTDYPDEVKNL